MANFDYQSFIGAFLNTVGQGIKERTDNIDEYTDILDKEYTEAKSVFKNRKAIVENGMSLVGKAKSLGANDQQIKAAVASSKAGLSDFVKGLSRYSANKGGGTLSFSEVDALVEGEELFEEGDVREFLERSYGLMQDEEDKTQYVDERSGFQKVFAVDPRGSAKAMFGTDKMNMIELARQDAYDSLAPDRSSVFLTLDQAKSNIYDPLETNQDFIKEYEAAEKLVRSTDAFKKALGEGEQEQMIISAQQQVMERYVALFGQQFIDGLPMGVIPDEIMTLAELAEGADTTKSKLTSKVIEAAKNDLGIPITQTLSDGTTLKYTVDADGKPIGGFVLTAPNGKSLNYDGTEEELSEFKTAGFEIAGLLPIIDVAEEAIDSVPDFFDTTVTAEEQAEIDSRAQALTGGIKQEALEETPAETDKESVEKTLAANLPMRLASLKEEYDNAKTEEEKEKLVPKIRETVQSAETVGIFESDEFKFLKDLVTDFFAGRREGLAERRTEIAEERAAEVTPTENIEVQAVERFGGQSFTITPDQQVYINDRRTGKPKTLITEPAITKPLLENAANRTMEQLKTFFEFARERGYTSDKDRLLAEWNRFADKNLLSDFVRNKVISDIERQF